MTLPDNQVLFFIWYAPEGAIVREQIRSPQKAATSVRFLYSKIKNPIGISITCYINYRGILPSAKLGSSLLHSSHLPSGHWK